MDWSNLYRTSSHQVSFPWRCYTSLFSYYCKVIITKKQYFHWLVMETTSWYGNQTHTWKELISANSAVAPWHKSPVKSSTSVQDSGCFYDPNLELLWLWRIGMKANTEMTNRSKIIHAKLDSSNRLLFTNGDILSLLQACKRHVLTCLMDIVQRM